MMKSRMRKYLAIAYTRLKYWIYSRGFYRHVFFKAGFIRRTAAFFKYMRSGHCEFAPGHIVPMECVLNMGLKNLTKNHLTAKDSPYTYIGVKYSLIYDDTPYTDLFDGAWYAKSYMGLFDRLSRSPYEHYCEIGCHKGYLPFRNFDMNRFRKDFPDHDGNVLVKWFNENRCAFYFTDPLMPELLLSTFRQMDGLAQLIAYNQDARWAAEQGGFTIPKDAAVMLVPGMAYTFSLWEESIAYQNAVHELYEKYKREGRRVIAVTLPDKPTVLDCYSPFEPMPAYRYELLSSVLSDAESIELVIFQSALRDYAGYLDNHRDDPVLKVPERRLTVVTETGFPLMSAYESSLYEGMFDVVNCVRSSDLITGCRMFDFIETQAYEARYMTSMETARMGGRNHYLLNGWKKGFEPFGEFDLKKFEKANPDCAMNPLLYWFINRRSSCYFRKQELANLELNNDGIMALDYIRHNEQNSRIDGILPLHEGVRNVYMIAVSPCDAISGGIMSFYGIYELLKKLHGDKPDTAVIAATVPGEVTHSGFTYFDNDMPVFRFDQVIQRLQKTERLVLFFPELYCGDLLRYLTVRGESPIHRVGYRHLNIMNQNIDLMCTPETIEGLKNHFDLVTQTAAHKRYCRQYDRDHYKIPCHLLFPPIRKKFVYTPYEKREKIFLYSPDSKTWRRPLLAKIQSAFPDYEFIEIINMPFRQYLSLISRAKWCMSFGEGLDGYFVEPYETGGVSFAVWNELFFTEQYRELPTVLKSPEDAMNRIVEVMRELDNKEAYEKVSAKVKAVHDEDYNSGESSEEQLIRFFAGDYDFP